MTQRIQQIGVLSNRTVRLLENGGIVTAGDLLGMSLMDLVGDIFTFHSFGLVGLEEIIRWAHANRNVAGWGEREGERAAFLGMSLTYWLKPVKICPACHQRVQKPLHRQQAVPGQKTKQIQKGQEQNNGNNRLLDSRIHRYQQIQEVETDPDDD